MSLWQNLQDILITKQNKKSKTEILQQLNSNHFFNIALLFSVYLIQNQTQKKLAQFILVFDLCLFTYMWQVAYTKMMSQIYIVWRSSGLFNLLWKYDNLLAKLRSFTLLSAHVQLDLVISELLWKKTWIESVNRGTRCR